MFNVKHNECVGFESRWKIKKISSVASTQTTDFTTVQTSTNTTSTKSIDIQTEIANNSKEPVVDDKHLAHWLKQTLPKVQKELNEAINSKAFRGYKLLSDKSDAYCKLLQTIPTADKNLSISTLSWNCTGKILAVSSNYINHKSWCTHDGSITIYRLTAGDLLSNESQLKLKTESCVTDTSFHPNLPNIIAVGTFGGDIIIWNIVNDEDQMMVKIIGHNDNITQLLWINDINIGKTINLVSSGLDGRLKIWNFNQQIPALTIKQQYSIKSPILSRFSNINDSGDDEISQSNELIGKPIRSVVCFDFSKFIPDMFIVGAEGGLVVQCSLLGAIKLKKTDNETIPIFDPVYKYYVPHKGEINTVSFSPNRREMFLTSSTDGQIRIYLIEQEEPARVIFPKMLLNTVLWVPFEEKIITGCGAKNMIEIFDVIEAKPIENTTKEKIPRGLLTKMSINSKRTNTVVVGSRDGVVQLWKVPWTQFGNL